MSKFQVGDDGKKGYKRWKGKPYDKDMVEFGEFVHYKHKRRTTRGSWT